LPEDLKRTPLFDCHREAGARLVEFAGWEMPVQYAGVMDEHRAVRSAAGLFDVSHMGEFVVSGSDAESFLQHLTPNDVSKLKVGRAHYSGLLTEDGTYVDDLLIYRRGHEEFLLVPNAANIADDFEWVDGRLREYLAVHRDASVALADRSDDYALLALQGPKSPEILGRLSDGSFAEIRYYGFAEGKVAGVDALVSRTGYTGEDGFELYVSPDDAAVLWRALLEAGAPDGLMPAGLGARDTLRLEAAMALYGHEIDRDTTPLEAGLQWVVKLAKGDFIGREVLAAQKADGVRKTLVGFKIVGRGIARQGHSIVADGEPIGVVTSGTFSPTLETAIGLAHVPPEQATEGTNLTIEVRGRTLEATVCETPFYRRPKPEN